WALRGVRWARWGSEYGETSCGPPPQLSGVGLQHLPGAVGELRDQPLLAELPEPPLHGRLAPALSEEVRVADDVLEVLHRRCRDRVPLVEGPRGTGPAQAESGVVDQAREVGVLPAIADVV